MRFNIFFIALVFTRVIASPLKHVNINRRSLVDFISNVADETKNTGDDAIPALSRELIKISKDFDGGSSRLNPRAIDFDLSQFPFPPLESIETEAIGNAALWQEAVDTDARINANEGINKFFFRLLNHVQESEFNTSLSLESRVLVARGLQFLNIYPARFDQAQAAIPADSLGRSSYYLLPHRLSPLTLLQCECPPRHNRQFNLSGRPEPGGPTT